MKTKFFTTQGTLTRCVKSDLIKSNGTFVHDKIFFLKNYVTGEFCSSCFLPDNTMFSGEADISNDYTCIYNEIAILLHKNLIYKLSELHHELDFRFHLYIRTAHEFDLFYSPKYLKTNAVYYFFDKSEKVIGPYQIREHDDPVKFMEWLNEGLILVPNKTQKFEKIITA